MYLLIHYLEYSYLAQEVNEDPKVQAIGDEAKINCWLVIFAASYKIEDPRSVKTIYLALGGSVSILN